MPYDLRQQAMLRGMGLRVWQPQAGAAAPARNDNPPADTPAPPARPPTSPPPRQATSPTAEAAPAAGLPAATDSRAQRIASLDWQALREDVAQCRACALCDSRTQTVFGVGHPQAQWLIVGEAPGEQEDRRGEPFVGPAGQMLDQMLKALGLSRAAEGPEAQRVHIVNTLKCRPPRNRNPTADELALCAPYLERQIALLAPRLILAMGRFAVSSLLRSDEPVGRLRGRVHRVQGVPTVVTYHPAYLLRTPSDKQRAWDDLCLAAQAFDATPALPGP